MNRKPCFVTLDDTCDSADAIGHTLRRLGQDWFYFRVSTPEIPEGQPLAWLTEHDHVSDADRPTPIVPHTLQLRVTCRWVSPFRIMRSTEREHFDLMDPPERLCLLGRLAAERLKRDSTTEECRLGSGISQCITLIQRAFDLHLTVENLSWRVGVNATTVRRWSSRESTGSIEDQLIVERVRALQQDVLSSGDSVSECARRLQFANVQSAGRLLRAYRKGW